MALRYQRPDLVIGQTTTNDPDDVKALQHDLRQLGYLKSGIDGNFKRNSESAVRALQIDLMQNDGKSTEGDGDAPIAVRDYNRGRVSAVTGLMDQPLAQIIAELVAEPRFPKLPRADDPAAENAKALAAVAASPSTVAPVPFMIAIFRQESDGRHYNVPGKGDQDTFVVVGLDHKNKDDTITSRGYGVGQYTLFHHPPTNAEVRDVISDPAKNVTKAFKELREKFDDFLVGPADTADDRTKDHPGLPLRNCRYAESEPKYLRACLDCARAVEVNKIDLAGYHGVPSPADFPCDWPYAVRRYNGGGKDSYIYQAKVLLNLLNAPVKS